jgi:hypothetical protein
MTKKDLIDLLNSEQCKMLPDDAPVMFRTDKKLRLCQQMQPENISFDMEFEPDPYWERYHGYESITQVLPGIKTVAIVIDAMPREWIKKQFHTTFAL